MKILTHQDFAGYNLRLHVNLTGNWEGEALAEPKMEANGE